jgi:hypothetical protein
MFWDLEESAIDAKTETKKDFTQFWGVAGYIPGVEAWCSPRKWHISPKDPLFLGLPITSRKLVFTFNFIDLTILSSFGNVRATLMPHKGDRSIVVVKAF